MKEVIQELINSARKLRDHGYAVVIFNPKELAGCEPRDVQDVMIHEAENYIITNRDEKSEESEESMAFEN